MSMNTIVKQFLAGLRRTRTGHRSSAAGIYWPAGEALAAGKEPTCKPAALAEAMERLGKTEADLERDAHLIAELAQAQSVAAKETAAVQRIKAAVGAKAAADQKAAALEEQARKLRSEAEAAVVEASRELNGVRKANSRVAELTRELAKRQHPAHVQQVEHELHQRVIEAKQRDLAAVEKELSESEAALATFAGVDGGAESALTRAARRARQDVLRLRADRDRLAAEIQGLRGIAQVDDGEDVTDQLLAEEVRP